MLVCLQVFKSLFTSAEQTSMAMLSHPLRRRRQSSPSPQPNQPFSGMNNSMLVVTFTFVLTWLVPTPARAYYCDDNLCSAEQFCCGENICCNYVNDTVWRLVCTCISVIFCGMVLWGFFQLFLVLIAIYFGGRQQQQQLQQLQRHSPEVEGDLQESGDHYYHHHQQPARPQTGFLADIESGKVSLAYLVRKLLSIAFNRSDRKGGGGEEGTAGYHRYSSPSSSANSSSNSHTPKQSSLQHEASRVEF